jgi:hypothetical protein
LQKRVFKDPVAVRPCRGKCGFGKFFCFRQSLRHAGVFRFGDPLAFPGRLLVEKPFADFDIPRGIPLDLLDVGRTLPLNFNNAGDYVIHTRSP